MKKITVLIFIALFAISCNNNQTDLEESNIKGKVWKIQETSFEGEEKFGKYQVGDKNYWGNNLYILNEYGNLVESHTLDKKGKSETVSKYSYNENNTCSEISTFSEDELIGKQTNIIQGNKIAKVKLFDEDGELENIYQYEYSGQDLTSGKIFNKENKLTKTFENKYSNGFVEERIVKDSIKEVSAITKYLRNNNGDIIEEIVSYPKDTSENKYLFGYEYDKMKNWIKQFQFDKEGKIENIIVRKIIYFGDSKESKAENDFIGMWFVIDDNDWIEFREDKKYDFGYKDWIKESGNWEIDTKQQLLTFRANDPDDSRKYKYDFDGYHMVLYTVQGDEKLRLEKR